MRLLLHGECLHDRASVEIFVGVICFYARACLVSGGKLIISRSRYSFKTVIRIPPVGLQIPRTAHRVRPSIDVRLTYAASSLPSVFRAFWRSGDKDDQQNDQRRQDRSLVRPMREREEKDGRYQRTRRSAMGRFEPFAGDARLTGLVESRYEQRRSSPSVRLGNRFAPAA
jgi:hypothetical protein